MNVNNYSYDNQGLALTEGFEGCRLVAYLDPNGVWTIGFGHTGPDVYAYRVVTDQEAVDLLHNDVATAVECVNRCVAVPITQDEFDALVDFAYNEGCGAFQRSTLLRDLNAGNFGMVAAQFAMWVYCGGAKNSGLMRRRDAEEALFVRGEA